MYEIVELVATAIDSEILGVRRIVGPVEAGQTELTLADMPGFCCFTRGYLKGDEIVIYDPYGGDYAERGTILDLTDSTLTLAHPLSVAFATTNIQKAYDGQYVAETYRGDPGSIARYPSIVVSYQGWTEAPLTIGATREDHVCDIEIYVSGTARETAYRMLHTLSDRVARGFHRAVYPATWETYGPDWSVYDPRVIDCVFSDKPTGDALLMSSIVTVSLGVARDRILPMRPVT